jgi:Ca2+-transporting ATPase
VAIGSLMLLAVLTFQPLMDLFEIAPLIASQYGVIFGLSLMPLILVQIFKTLFNK